ncbi:MAG: MFS transporter [Ketobacter sp.]|jgi:MFS family permease|nr:MFS transporter [Pseudomonadales bacterium]MCK5792302.1 MFS transporter [Ketobacter sp.]MEC8810356.1 MFS transporter [Pseudomonadota bacterium]
MNSFEIRATWSLASLFALRMLGLFMILPVFALYGQDLEGATPALIGIAIGAYGLTQALFQIPFGLLSDRIGRKPVIIAGLLIFLLGSLVAAQAETIYGVIAGRTLQGAGAIASAIMALLTDLTRDDQRAKAMAMVGASIGMSFALALVAGPVLAGWFELRGLFLFTAVLAGFGVALTMWVVPAPDVRKIFRDTRPVVSHFSDVLRDTGLLRLDFGVFCLHMVLTASFVVLPGWLLTNADMDKNHHWMIYLPILFLSFVLMLPLMIVAEKARKIKQVFLLAVLLLGGSLFALSQWHDSLWPIAIGLFVFFWGFNLLEALLPSLVSKLAAPGFKGTSMGVYSTCQFLGAFAGGAGGGWLLGQYGDSAVYMVGAGMVAVWFLLAWSMKQPAYLQSVTLPLTQTGELDAGVWASRLMGVTGVEEAVVIEEERAAYLKVDNARLDREQLKQLSQLSMQSQAEPA